MSVSITKSILKEFLTNSDPSVLALTGSWGSGKTYVWREALYESRREIKFKKYCYVSLFGISKMSELRLALFMRSENTATIGDSCAASEEKRSRFDGAISNVKALTATYLPALRNLPKGNGISVGLEVLASNLVRDTLICFDDFERLSSISQEEVLGLITELREDRKCKIALIFNSTKLPDSHIYASYREKVVDLEVAYEPTAHEAADIVFDANFILRDYVIRHTNYLNITNIRVLRKIRQNIRIIQDHTRTLHPDVLSTAIPTIVLFCWCAYEPESYKPKLSEIKTWNAFLSSPRESLEKTPEKLEWSKRLKAYGFIHVDSFDATIAKIVECGYVDGTGFAKEAKSLDESLRNVMSRARFEKAWSDFRNNFLIEEEKFIEELYEGAKEAIACIHANDLNSTVKLLRELRHDGLSESLIHLFISANQARPSVFDLSRHPFGDSIDDAGLIKAFESAHAANRQLPTLEEALTFAAENSGYNPEHLEAIKCASVDDFLDLFLRSWPGDQLSNLITWSLRWRGTEQSEISVRATEALNRIKDRNLLNSIQVARRIS